VYELKGKQTINKKPTTHKLSHIIWTLQQVKKNCRTDCVLQLNFIFSLQILDNLLKEEEEEEEGEE